VAHREDKALQWHCLDFDALTTRQLYGLLKLRQEIFILEQSCLYPDIDSLDPIAQHIFACRDDSVMACLRSLPPGTDYRESSFGRVAVSVGARGMQLGRQLVERGIDYNLRRWPGQGIRIGAQAYLESFYRDMGFATDSEVYIEDGIPHIKMTLKESP
jgi:ElaA protein